MKKIIRKYDYLAGKYRYRLREILFSKKPASLKVEDIPFNGYLSSLKYLPDIDATILNTNIDHQYSYNGTIVDIIQFKQRTIRRYSVATPYLSKIIKLARKHIPNKKNLKNLNIEGAFNNFFRTPHTSHMTPNGYICATNIYCLYLIDANTNKAYFLPEDFDKKLMFYIQSGGFSPDFKYFYFIRWPFEDSVQIRNRERKLARCEIGRLTIQSREIEIIYKLELPEEVHQISCTKDYKHLLVACFNMQLAHFIPITKIPVAADIERYKETALQLSKITTYDIQKNTHWETELPVPIPAHFELDPTDPAVIYASAHNIFSHPVFDTISGGPGAIFKMKIEEGKTTIESSYSDANSIRVTQHRIFIYKGKKYLVFTTTPYQFQIIDLENMALWRKVRIQPDPPFEFSDGFAQVAATFPLSLDVSDDNLYIIAGQVDKFYVYDIEKDYILDVILYLPAGKGLGHTRPLGE